QFMWQWVTAAWAGVKSLFGGKGTLQIGSGNKSNCGVTIGDNAGNVILGDITTSTPLVLPPPEPQLSDYAKQILLDGADDAKGTIYFNHTQWGYNLHAGKTEIRNCLDNHTVAEIKAVLQELQVMGAVEVYGNVGYKITDPGYERAAALKV